MPLFSSAGVSSYLLPCRPAMAGRQPTRTTAIARFKTGATLRMAAEGSEMTKLKLNRRTVLAGAGAAATSLATGARVARASCADG